MTATVFPIPRIWPGTAIVCIASGPSLSLKQIATIYKARMHGSCRVIAVNDNYLIAPWSDVLYACDFDWWRVHQHDLCCFYGSMMLSCMPEVNCEWPNVRYIPFEDKPGLSDNPSLIYSGCNSGYQAVNVAVHLGARKIVLVGYDHTRNGQKHWFGEHPQPINKWSDYSRWVNTSWSTVPDSAKELKIDIVNCTPGSRLDMFRASDIETELYE